jgi:membrane associated rhomboid family serine protease
MGLWLLVQIKSGFHMLTPDPTVGDVESVAYWAHAGGFAFGGMAMLPIVFKR